MQNEYQPPGAELATGGARKPRSILVAGLIGGVLVDFGGTMLLGGIAAVVALGSAIAEPDAAEILSEPRYALPLSALGVVMTIAGGFVAAKWSQTRHVFSGATAGVFSLLAAGPFLLAPGGMDPMWLNLPLAIVHIPLSMLGGRFAAPHAA